MNGISSHEFDHIAHLARLRFSSKERAQMMEEMAQMIAFADALCAAPSEGGNDCLPGGQSSARFRDDLPTPSFPREDILQNAPLTDGACFLVPRTVEEGDG